MVLLQEPDVEQGLSSRNFDRGAYSRARPADLPPVPERRRSDAATEDDVMNRSNTEEMMLGSGSGDEERPQVMLDIASVSFPGLLSGSHAIYGMFHEWTRLLH